MFGLVRDDFGIRRVKLGVSTNLRPMPLSFSSRIGAVPVGFAVEVT
jgi:hypothetical protein